MKRVLGVARREFSVYFDSPIAYIVIVLFVASLSWMFFDMASFFIQGQATMRAFFDYIPLVFIPFIPAITMRLWSEERRSGTEELLLTLPMNTWEIVLGKFLAGLTLVAAALISSLPLAFTVSALGPLDWGPVWGGYVGALFLGGACIALGLFISSLTRNQIIAFIVTMVLLFALYMLGSGGVLMRLTPELVPWFDYISIGSHYESAMRGILDFRDVFYYLAFIVLFLYLNSATLQWRKWS